MPFDGCKKIVSPLHCGLEIWIACKIAKCFNCLSNETSKVSIAGQFAIKNFSLQLATLSYNSLKEGTS